MDGAWKRAISVQEIVCLAGDIDRRGCGIIENYISSEELAPIRALAEARVREMGGEYVALMGPDSVNGTLLSELPHFPEFRNLFQRLFELGMGERATRGPDFYQVLRCLQGPTGQHHCNRFHYDGHFLSAIIPIAIPETGMRGDFVLISNPRTIRGSYLVNLLDKLLVYNAVSQWAFRTAARRNFPRIVRMRMRPGSLYLFWGYRSIHTNEPCDEDKLRATAVFHYGDPHENSHTRRIVRSLSKIGKHFYRRLTPSGRPHALHVLRKSSLAGGKTCG
jgi:hypothetical protein